MSHPLEFLRNVSKPSSQSKAPSQGKAKRKPKFLQLSRTDSMVVAKPSNPPIPTWAGNPSPLRTLSEPLRRWVPGHAERHQTRQNLHQKIYDAVEFSLVGAPASKAAWREVVQRCATQGLSLGAQLGRCSGEQHVLDLLLDAQDYDALGVLAGALQPGVRYGRVQVIRSNSTDIEPGVRHGRVQVIRSSAIYIGEVRTLPNRVVQAHGFGRRADLNGCISQGRWQNNYLWGTSCERTQGDTRYVGAYVDGSAHGHGVIFGPDGRSESNWVEGKRHGYETIHYKDGAKAMLTHDHGKLMSYECTERSGAHYTGDVDAEEHLPHGRGKYTMPDGTCYEGEYRMNTRHGSGALTFGCDHALFGYRYIGSFINGQAHGHGVFENIATLAKLPCFYRQGKLHSGTPPSLVEA